MPRLTPRPASKFAFQTISLVHPMIAIPAILSLSVSFLLGCGSKSSAPPDDPRASSAEAVSDRDPAARRESLNHPTIRIETSLGRITIKLDSVDAPGTVRNFLNYVAGGFYDDTTFHYVAPGNMALGGGYRMDNQPKAPTFPPILNEAHNGRKNTRGTIAMARDPAIIDSATTQFFINLSDAPQRDHTGESPEQYGYCVFGEVTEGLEVVDRIAQSPTQNLGGDLIETPNPPVVINSIRAL